MPKLASFAYIIAIVSAKASFLVPWVDLPTSLPKKFLINSAGVMSFFLKTALPWAVFSLTCLPSLSKTASLNAGNLLFMILWGIPS